METKKMLFLVVGINFLLPLHILLFWGFFHFYLDYAMNLIFLSFLVIGSMDLKTDKRKFRGLILMKIIPIILYIYYLLIQVVYPFINLILGKSLLDQ